MSPRLIAFLIFVVWLATIVFLFHHLGCSPTNPC